MEKQNEVVPEWQRAKWFTERYGLTGYMLNALALQGRVRERKFVCGRSGAHFYSVDDVVRLFSAGGVTPPYPAAHVAKAGCSASGPEAGA